MNKLKNIDFKQVFIDHGEKFGLGIVSLIALFALVGTSWGTYKEITPTGMKDKAQTTLQQMRDSKFTADEALNYLIVDEGGPNPNINVETAKLHAAIDLARYEYSTDMTWPAIKKDDPIREIVYAKPRAVIASAGRTLIPLNARAAAALEEASGESTELAAADGEMADSEEETVESEFDRRTGNRGGGGLGGGGLGGGGLGGGYPGGGLMGGGAMGGAMGGAGGYGGYGGDEDDEGDYGTGAEMGAMRGGMGGAMGGAMGGYMGDSASAEKEAVPARGHHYAAVRAIFPLREQQVNVANAMHMSPTDKELKAIVYVTNLIVERKMAVRGKDPWSGEWEQIDIQTAQDVLDEADGIEPDVVRPEVTDPAITMPLPPRMVGYWTDHGSHPELETYQLSELDQELLHKRDELLLKYGKEDDQDAKGPAQKGGFSKNLVNINSFRSSVMAGGSSQDTFNNEMGDFMNKIGEQTGIKTDLKKRLKVLDGATASGHLLLIRFLDFSVNPGRVYKYRVRVELRNPLFNLPIEELDNPELANRQTWQTEWSEPSKPIHVPFEYHYFVDDADARLGRETMAELDVFEWFKDSGSLINSVLRVYPGQFVGGRRKTDVLRFAAETFKEETVEFTTDDLLVDVTGSREIDQDDNPYLKVPRQRGGYQLPAEVLVMNKFFEVYSMDGVSRQRARNDAHARYQEMVDANEDLKQAAKSEGDPNDPYGGFMGGGDEDEDGGGLGGYGSMGGAMGGSGGRRGSRSSRRRGRGRRSLLGGMDGSDE